MTFDEYVRDCLAYTPSGPTLHPWKGFLLLIPLIDILIWYGVCIAALAGFLSAADIIMFGFS